jgi:hypothetical protein
MTKLKDKVRTGLDEDRMLVLVVQVLIGFQFRGVFEAGFDRLSPNAQYLKLVAFGLLLLTLVMLLTIPSYHRIVEQGENTPQFNRVIGRIMTWALLPFALALGVDFAVVSHKLFGRIGGLASGCAAAGAALFFWYVLELIARRHRNEDSTMNEPEHEKTSLADKVKEVLTEGRIVLPGAQALLGFQLSVFFTDAFDKLPRQSQTLHLAALSCVGLTAILLMTPPAYHRIVEKGEETEHFHRVANWFVVSAMVPLALGITIDFYVVLKKVTHSAGLSLGVAAVVLALFYGFWFVYPWLRSRNGERAGLIVTAPAQ